MFKLSKMEVVHDTPGKGKAAVPPPLPPCRGTWSPGQAR